MQDRQARRPRRGVRPAGARADRPRRHERLGRAVQGLQEARRQADPRPRGVLRRRPLDPRGQDRAQPPHAAGAGRRRLPEPDEAVERRLPRGPAPRQAGRGHGAARAARQGRHRALGLPRLARQPPDRGRPPRRRPRAPGRPGERVRPRERLLRDPAQRHRRAGAGQRGDRQVRPRDGPAARRDRRRALPPQGGLPPPRGAAVRADEVDARPAEDVLRHQRVLPQELGGDGAVVRRVPGGARLHGGDRRALRRVDRARRPAHPALRDAERRVRARPPALARRRRPAPALRRSGPRGGARARRHGARRDRSDGLQRLLPDRARLRRLREGQRHRGRSRPRLGGGLDRRLLPGDHGRRPAPLRPAVRALPERRARVDARHRHRLLRARPGAGDPLRDRQVRRRPRRADHHVRQDVPPCRDARRGPRPGPRVRDRRPARQADPGPAAGAPAELHRLPLARPGAGQRGREGPDRQADRRRRAGPGGDRPQRVDPRGRRRHLRPRADRHRPAPARRRGRGGGRRQGLPHGHAVLDEADRGDRPAQDGLPRPAQPRRDRGRAGHRRALDRRAPGHDDAAARRREDLRDDGGRRRGRRVPVRVRGHARGAEEGPADRVRGPRRARGAVPPGCDGPDPDLRARQAQPRVDQLHRRPPAPDHRGHQGRDPVPGAVDADRQGARRLLGPQGGRPAQGDRQEEPRGDGQAQARVRGGLPRLGHRAGRDRVPVGDEREVRRLLVQQVPCGVLRADLLPHRVAEGELPGRVHGRADLLGDGHEGQGARSSSTRRRAWASTSCRPT